MGQYCTSMDSTIGAWIGHRSVPPVTMTKKGKGGLPYEHGKILYEHGQYRTSMYWSEVSTTCDLEYYIILFCAMVLIIIF